VWNGEKKMKKLIQTNFMWHNTEWVRARDENFLSFTRVNISKLKKFRSLLLLLIASKWDREKDGTNNVNDGNELSLLSKKKYKFSFLDVNFRMRKKNQFTLIVNFLTDFPPHFVSIFLAS
jgi:hypothetical protein